MEFLIRILIRLLCKFQWNKWDLEMLTWPNHCEKHEADKVSQESKSPPVSLTHTSKECIKAWLFTATETWETWGPDISLPTQLSPITGVHPCTPLLPLLKHFFWETFDLILFETQECVLKLMWILNLLLRLNNNYEFIFLLFILNL